MAHKAIMRTERLIQFRQLRDYTQEEVAARAGISPAQYYRIETGKSMPAADTIAAIARTLEVSVDYLLGLVDDPKGTLAPRNLTPEEMKLLAAADRGDLEGMIDAVLEIHRENKAQARPRKTISSAGTTGKPANRRRVAQGE